MREADEALERWLGVDGLAILEWMERAGYRPEAIAQRIVEAMEADEIAVGAAPVVSAGSGDGGGHNRLLRTAARWAMEQWVLGIVEGRGDV